MTARKLEQIPAADDAAEAVTPSEKPDAAKNTARRVLVAEDSPVTQDLLKLVLEQRGHQVDMASDGEAALKALEKQSYDVVLLDFHLPKMDGLEVASKYRSTRAGSPGPRFVAITADIKGLLSHSANCENFDEVIPKPLDMEDVLKVVERECEDGPITEPASAPGAMYSDGAVKTPGNDKYNFLRWPEDFNSDRLSARCVHASLGDGSFDAILLNAPATVRDLSAIWTTKTLHLLPIIDMTGSVPKLADLDGSKVSVDETDEIDQIIKAFYDRRADLHHDLIYTDDIGEKLLGRMFVSGGTLSPRYDHTSSQLICYNTVLDFRSIDKAIKELRSRDLVDRSFFDKFHNCDRCGSAQFNIREECVECGSPDLKEESYLHHFKCAYQGPESDFREGDDLVCPKCRMELSHFSVDYDKPGSMMQCQSCDHATSEPDIGFVCMECEAHYDGDTVKTRNVYAYELSAQGNDFARAGRALLDGANSTLRFAELPLELIVSMNAEIKKFNTDKTPFSLLNLSYRNEFDVELAEGARMFEKSRDMVLENLRNTVRESDKVFKGHNCDFVLLTGFEPDEVRSDLEELSKEATASLRVDVGLHIDVFGPEDFS